MAGALQGETTRYLLVYEEAHIGQVTEAEVAAAVAAAGGRLLAWHASIGTALAASEDTAFSPNAVAQVRRRTSCGCAVQLLQAALDRDGFQAVRRCSGQHKISAANPISRRICTAP